MDAVQAMKKQQHGKYRTNNTRNPQTGNFASTPFNNVIFQPNRTWNGRSNSNYGGNSNNSKGFAFKVVKCFRCGKGHLASQCTLSREIRCSGCGGKGHLKRVCFKSNEQANHLEEILQLEHPQFRDKFYWTLYVNGKQVKFEVDSGSAVTVMNRFEARRLFPGSIIHFTELNLIAFCKTSIKIVGYITVLVKDKQMQRELNIYITEINRKPLLGRE